MLSRKIKIWSAAALLAVTPISFVAINHSAQIVQAARQIERGKITITDSYLTQNNGRTPIKKGTVFPFYGNPVFKPFDPGAYYFGELQYNVGHKNKIPEGKISSDDAKQISGSNWLTSINNDHLYNKKGYRLSAKIRRGQTIAFPGKIKNAKHAKYYFMVNKTKKYIPYQRIKGQDFYNLGHGRYVKVSDIFAVNAHSLLTNKQVTGIVRSNNVRTFTDSNDYAHNTWMTPADKYLKKGQKLTFDQAVTFSSQLNDFDHDPYDYYRIKGTNLYVSAYSLYLPKALPSHLYENDHYSRLDLINKKTPLYDAMGQETKELLPSSFEVNVVVETSMDELQHADEELYLWVPSENKAELFYHVVGQPALYYENRKVNQLLYDGYVKASAVRKVKGLKLKVSNTPQEAQAQAVKASNKTSLNNDIQAAQQVKNTDQYKLADYDAKIRFDGYLASAQEISKSNQATVLAVNQADRELVNAQKALNGKKLQVGRYDQLSDTEVRKILRLAYNLIKPNIQGTVNPNVYSKNNNFQEISERPYWNLSKNSSFWLGYATTAHRGKVRINIADLATESKHKPALKKLVRQAYILKGTNVQIYNGQGKLLEKYKAKKTFVVKVSGHKSINHWYMARIGNNRYTPGSSDFISYRWIVKK